MLPPPPAPRGRCFFIRASGAGPVNKRYVIVGAVLGIILAAAFFAGSPMFGGLDGSR